MDEIIKISERITGQKCVSARELYEKLGLSKSVWSRWFKKNIVDNKFAIENTDWAGFNIMLNGNETQDFALSIDFAKKLCMLSRTDQGEKIRDYFITIEKKLNGQPEQTKQLPQTYVAALRDLADEVERRELVEKKLFELEPKAEVFDRISNADNLLAMNSAAKSLGTTRPKLFQLLRDRNILMGNNLPYQKYIESGMFKVKIKPIEMGHSGTIDYPQTFVTAKGLTWLGKGIIKIEKEKL